MANLEAEIRRTDPYADAYHIDVCDGHYAPNLLFFPDLVAAIRGKTEKPFEVHLITEHPEKWVAAFDEAGADSIIFYPDAAKNPEALVNEILSRDLEAGISLSLEHPASLVEKILDRLDLVVVIGTESGIKGVQTVAPAAYEKIRLLKQWREERGLDFEIEADGAIRVETVPLLREAGVDVVVPGSLMFKYDMAEISRWLRSL
jgi:ribulose-phosphate 3-epimerase